jgi:hypothetical protein
MTSGAVSRSAGRRAGRTAELRLKSAVLLMVLVGSILPSCSRAKEVNRSMDEALLLALASHEQLELGQATAGTRGGGRATASLAAAAPRTKNPHWHLASWYEDMAQRRESTRGPLYDYAVQKIQEHNRLAMELDQARARRAERGRGFQRFVRGVVQVPVKVTRGAAWLLKGTVRVTGTVIAIAIEQAPQIAREMVRKKLQELRNLLQGRIDLAWDKIAARLGVPFALWLRSRVDPAFVRLRDRTVAHLLRQNRRTPSPGVTVTAEPTQDEADQPAYGNWTVDLTTDNEACAGGFTWSNYWVNLPAIKSGGDDCQRALEQTHHVDFFFEPGVRIPLVFELDAGKVTGGLEVSSFDNVVGWERVGGSVATEIEGGWVRPRADNQGWEFGGEFVTRAHGVVALECWYQPEDPMVAGFFHWINDDKQTETRTVFQGSTEQFVPGQGEDPGRVAPGGTIHLTVGEPYEDLFPASPILEIACMNQPLPADFPPPVAESAQAAP